jgi:hypothetical protein
MDTLRAKFQGGPRDKKTRSLKGVSFPLTIEVPEDCGFHNVRGHYCKRGESQGVTATYEWVPAT